MEKNSVWSRVSAWLRGDPALDVGTSNTPQNRTSSPDPKMASRGVASNDRHVMTGAAAGVATGKSPGQHTNDRLDLKAPPQVKPPAADDRIEKLVASIKEHLESQVQSSDVLVGALDRLAEGLEGLPSAAKSELDVLERIGNDLASGLGTLKRLETTLGHVPKIADSQREAIVALNNELARQRETDEKIVGALSSVQQVMVELRDGIGRSAGVMRDFRTEMAERHDQLAGTIERQVQRVVKIAVAALALGGVAVVLGLLSVFR